MVAWSRNKKYSRENTPTYSLYVNVAGFTKCIRVRVIVFRAKENASKLKIAIFSFSQFAAGKREFKRPLLRIWSPIWIIPRFLSFANTHDKVALLLHAVAQRLTSLAISLNIRFFHVPA